MTVTRHGVAAVSMILLLAFAVGVFFLVRLGMGASSNAGIPPIASSDAAPRNGSPTTADNLGPGGEPGDPEPQQDSDPTISDNEDNAGTRIEPGGPDPQQDSDPTIVPTTADNTPTTTPETQPPRPAVRMSSVGGIGPRIFYPYDPHGGFWAQFHVEQAFSVQVRVVEINLIQSGNEMVIYDPENEDVTQCDLGTVEPEETGPLCTVRAGVSESAEPGYYQGTLELVVGATCTSKNGRPCQNLPENYAPSPDNPIDVIWDYQIEASAEKPDDESPSATAGPTS